MYVHTQSPEKSPWQMAMTKLNFFDKHIEDENSRTLLSQAKNTWTVNFNSKLSGLAKVCCGIGTQYHLLVMASLLKHPVKYILSN